jgi:hypothetical protein
MFGSGQNGVARCRPVRNPEAYRALRAKGWTYKRIVVKFGVTKQAVCEYVNKYGPPAGAES